MGHPANLSGRHGAVGRQLGQGEVEVMKQARNLYRPRDTGRPTDYDDNNGLQYNIALSLAAIPGSVTPGSVAHTYLVMFQ